MKERAQELQTINIKTLSGYPDPHLYGSVKERSLWVLHVAKEELNIERLGAANISRFLTEIIEIKTSPQAVKYSLYNVARGCVDKKNGTYKLMQKGRNEIAIDVAVERKDIYILIQELPTRAKINLRRRLFLYFLVISEFVTHT
ncbi:MAG: hypothetical protein HYR67_14355 [Bacteroidetes bacterium]|nr:hypothetical protein [Bacteroidota bacterium]